MVESYPEKRNLRLEMQAELDAHYASDRPPAERMPVNPDEAIEWFLGVVPPFDSPWDDPRLIPIPLRNAYRWEEPYPNRVMSCLKRFLRAEPSLQRLVAAAADDGIHWRGEPEHHYRIVIEEAEKMQDMGVEAYKQETLKKWRKWASEDFR